MAQGGAEGAAQGGVQRKVRLKAEYKARPEAEYKAWLEQFALGFALPAGRRLAASIDIGIAILMCTARRDGRLAGEHRGWPVVVGGLTQRVAGLISRNKKKTGHFFVTEE